MSKATDLTVEEVAQSLLDLAYANAEKMRRGGVLSGNDIGRIRADKETFLKSATNLLNQLVSQYKTVDKKPQVKPNDKNES